MLFVHANRLLQVSWTKTDEYFRAQTMIYQNGWALAIDNQDSGIGMFRWIKTAVGTACDSNYALGHNLNKNEFIISGKNL